jgi:hypothetical protein
MSELASTVKGSPVVSRPGRFADGRLCGGGFLRQRAVLCPWGGAGSVRARCMGGVPCGARKGW